MQGSDAYSIQPMFHFLIDIRRQGSLFSSYNIFLQMFRIERAYNNGIHIRMGQPRLVKMPIFSSSNMGRKAGSLLGCSNWIFYQDKVFEVTLQRAVSLLQVYDHIAL
jgi:hypothetical protein